jgi:Zn-dependent metalloprotease
MIKHRWLMRLVHLTISIVVLVSLLMSLLPGSVQTVKAQDPDPGAPTATPESGAGAQSTPPAGESGWRVSTNPDTGKVRFMGADPANPLISGASLGAGAQAEVASSAFFTTYGERFGINDPAGQLAVMKVNTGDDGSVSTRFQQMYQGVPVLGGEMIVQTDGQMDVVAATADLSQDLETNVNPTIDAEAARQAAIDEVLSDYLDLKADMITASDASLWIYDPALFGLHNGQGKSLVWKVLVSPNDPYPMWEYILVDAHSGEIRLHFNQIDHDYVPKRTIYDWYEDDGYWYRYLARSEGSANTGDSQIDNAYYFLGDAYYFYSDMFLRDSIDNRGMGLVANTRYPDSDGGVLANAFWSGVTKQLYFGDGYLGEDVVGHEYTHGVTQYESGLIYYEQSGAINESLSDVFGEFIEKTVNLFSDTDWNHGEDLPDGPNRSLKDPTIYGDPDKMNSSNYYCGFDDNGGVHWNSGVNNKAAYLIGRQTFDGPVTFNEITVTGIGINKAAKIYYEAQTNLLTSSADYPDLYDALNQACVNVKNKGDATQADCDEVKKALDAVEMDTVPCVGARGYIYPTATKLEAPSGTIDTLSPDFVWKIKSDATDYQLLVKDAKKAIVFQKWYSGSDEAVCKGSTCVVSGEVPALQYGGAYTWAVQTRNPVGDGPLTPYAKYTVSIPGTPPAPTQISPNGDVGTALPEFEWWAMDGVSDYVLTVKNALTQKVIYSLSYKAGAICGGGHCLVTPTKKLASGDYAWTVQAKYQKTAGIASIDMDFTVNALPASVAMLYEPTGTILVQPSFVWSSVSNATSYILSLTGASGKIIQEFDAVTLGCASGEDTCSVSLEPRVLEGGSHTWTVQAKNAVGLSPVSNKQIFTLSAPLDPPGLNHPVSTDTLTTSLPDFNWNLVDLATSYTIALTGPTKYTKTYPASAVCSGGTCTVNPMVPLKEGDNTWTLKASNKAGFSTASATFHAPAWGPAPTQPVLSEPLNKARIDNSVLPVLKWASSTNATSYLVTVTAKGFNYSKMSDAADLGCDAPGTCQFTIPSLPGPGGYGTYKWTVTPYNDGVPGPKSATFTFSVVLTAPFMLTPVASNVDTARLDFSWIVQDTATRYDLSAYTLDSLGNPSSKPVYKATITPSKSCGSAGDPCFWSIPALLPTDYGYRWTLYGSNKAGAGLTSTTDFETRPYNDSEFTSDSNSWNGIGGYSDWGVAGGKLYTTGNNQCEYKAEYGYWICYTGWSIATNNYTDYGYVDVQANVTRTGSCKGCSNSLIVRADFWDIPYFLKSGYLFNIDNYGEFSVFRLEPNGTNDYYAIPLQPWTMSKAIKKGGANVLRVVAIGSEFNYYINGVLVWVGSDDTYDTGKVGVGMYGNYYFHDKLSIDWVRIFQVPVTSILGAVDPAQQKLNLEALNKVGAQSTMGSDKYSGPAPQEKIKIKR